VGDDDDHCLGAAPLCERRQRSGYDVIEGIYLRETALEVYRVPRTGSRKARMAVLLRLRCLVRAGRGMREGDWSRLTIVPVVHEAAPNNGKHGATASSARRQLENK